MNLPESRLVAVFLELLFFGVYATIFFRHANLMYTRRNKSWGFIYHAGTSISLFLMITMHVGNNFVEGIDVFTSKMDVPNAPLALLLNNGDVPSQFRTWLLDIIIAVSDLFLVYRTHKVWNGRYIIVCLPFALWLAGVALSIWATVALYLTNESGNNAKFVSLQIKTRGQWFFISTLAENVLCTGLISYKLWSINHEVGRYRVAGSPYSRVLTVIAESAALYTAVLIAMIATELKGSTFFFVFLHALPPITGFVFSTILVRSSGATQSAGTLTNPDDTTLRFSERARSGGAIGKSSITPMNGVQIELHRTTRTDQLETYPEHSKEDQGYRV